MYSGFSNVDQSANPTRYIQRLDQTASRAVWQAIKQKMAGWLAVNRGDVVMDLGCGTGGDARWLAAQVGEFGRVIGVDISVTMLSEARARSTSLAVPVDYCLADAGGLSFADRTFHACRSERVLQHLEKPERAVNEMVRVLRNGGRIALAEPDYGGLVIRGANPTITGRILACRQAHFRAGTVGRALPSLLRKSGVEALMVTIIADEQETLDLWPIEALRATYVEPAMAHGAISHEEGARWLCDLEAADRRGSFRHAIPIFLVAGRKP